MVKILRENNEIKQTPVECIKGAALLSIEEAENLLTRDERMCKGTQQSIDKGLYIDDNGCSYYWLRSRGLGDDGACIVGSDGDVCRYYDVYFSDVGVRPALQLDGNLQSFNIKIGDIFEFGDYIFKVISNRLALCNVIIDVCCFNEHAKYGNNYETSCVKSRVDDWFKETAGIYKGIKTNKMIADENDFGF